MCEKTIDRRTLGRRRGFTLLEAMLASSILFGIVVAVTSAIVAGQQHAFEAQQRVVATIAAEALMGRIIAEESLASIDAWDKHVETVGAMVDEHGQPMPPMFSSLGREVEVRSETLEMTSPTITIKGRIVLIRVFEHGNRVVAELERFVAEPSA